MTFLPPASAVEVIESEPSVCVSVCVSVFLSVNTLMTKPCPSGQKDYRAKRLCLWGTREVSQRSGVFILFRSIYLQLYIYIPITASEDTLESLGSLDSISSFHSTLSKPVCLLASGKQEIEWKSIMILMHPVILKHFQKVYSTEYECHIQCQVVRSMERVLCTNVSTYCWFAIIIERASHVWQNKALIISAIWWTTSALFVYLKVEDGTWTRS